MAQKSSQEMYVAPVEEPRSRRPPISEVGLIKWLRDNLFGSWVDVILTVVTLVGAGFILYGMLDWILFQAQWEVVFLNQATLNTGNQFPKSEIWRIELVAFLVVFLSLLSVGVWGRIARGFAITLAIIGAIMVIVPWATTPVEEPVIYMYTEAGYLNRQVNFVADEGQEITFTIDPLTDASDYQISNISGYIENDNQQNNTSFDAFNNRTASVVTFLDVEPSEYDLNMAIEIWDADGALIQSSDYTQGTTEITVFTWEAPADGWFTYAIINNAEASGENGAAFVTIDNLEVFRSTSQGRELRLDKYGPQPELDCSGCATSLNRSDLRFQGKRTLAQWFSLQLAPYLLESRGFFFIAAIVGIIAYFIGQVAVKNSFNIVNDDLLDKTARFMLFVSGIAFVGYILIQISSWFIQQGDFEALQFFTLVAFVISLGIYAIIQFMKDDPKASSRAVTILWMLSIPIILSVVTGFESSAVPVSESLPAIPTGDLGGLFLTLLLSAVAIIASFPIGMALALGRQSDLPVVSLLSTLLIEVFRGVPLITLLFMGRLILPFFGFGLGDVDLVIRIIVVLTLFISAYLAEVIRGGLQVVPKGQIEAAYALGLNGFSTTTLIILPQALRAVIPAIMGQAVSLFKDTSLVYIVSLFEILGTMNQLLGDSQTGYIAFPREGYLYVGIVFFVFSYVMADISRRIERTGSGAIRRDTI